MLPTLVDLWVIAVFPDLNLKNSQRSAQSPECPLEFFNHQALHLSVHERFRLYVNTFNWREITKVLKVQLNAAHEIVIFVKSL